MIKLIDLEVYKVALLIGEKVWEVVNHWDHFNKDTLGKQFVRASDSMSLNIAEGYGRYFYKENKNFNYYSRGSAFESTTCLKKALERRLITEEENKTLRNLFASYFKLVNAYIKSIGQVKERQDLNEDQEHYNVAVNIKNEIDLDEWLNNDY